MIKYTFLFAFFIILCFYPITAEALDCDELSAEAAIVICADTNEIVFEKNAFKKLPMASTTKIMTSILALEYGASDYLYSVTEEMVSVEGSSIGLLPADKISLNTLVKGMLLESGNDAANCVAHIVAGSVEDFLSLMNLKADKIGMQSTSFETPSGLDGDNHYSTAYDMAVLGAYAIKNPEFRKICSSDKQVVYYGNEPYRRIFTNNNKLLKLYDGAFGIKTGFTKKSGRCLVSAAEQDGKTLIAVTLNAYDDWNDHIKMYDYSFPLVYAFNLIENVDSYKIDVVGGSETEVSVELVENKFFSTISKDFSYYSKVYFDKFLYAPVYKNDVVGYVEFYDKDNDLIFTSSLVASDNATIVSEECKEESIFDKFIDLFR